MPQVVVNNYEESYDEININFANIANEQYNQLNFDQKEIVDIILQVSNIIDYNEFKCFASSERKLCYSDFASS